MVKLYGEYTITGLDFGTVKNVKHRSTFSPNDINSVHIHSVHENILVITNNADIDYAFTISRANVPMATVKYTRSGVLLNEQWRIVENEMMNREMAHETIKQTSHILNFEIGSTGIGRFDIKYDKKEYVALLFDHQKMYSCRFNGDYAIKNFDEFITRECVRRPLDIVRIKRYLDFRNNVKLRIIRKFVVDWLQSNNKGEEFNSDIMIRRFLAEMRLEHVID